VGGRGIGRTRGVQAGTERVDQHDHAGTAAEGPVVHATIVAFGVVARIPAVQRQQAALLRATDHAETRALGDEFGKQADDVDAHWRED
jgi:hypothetical protein